MLFKHYLRNRIAIFFVFSMLLAMFALPNFSRGQTTTAKTYPFIEAIPNPVGVNQRTLINFGLLNFLVTADDGWNVTLTITDPSGQNTTVGPLKTWSTGTIGYSFTPTVAGKYILQSHFAQVVYNNVTYDASDSNPLILTVTTSPSPTYPPHSLPTEYWTRPIDAQLREWYSIAGSWIAVPPNLYVPYNQGPETAHILWNQVIGDMNGGLIGGLIGNDQQPHSYGTGDAYEGKFANSIIIEGVLYYNKMGSPFFSTVPTQEVVAVDLHTGKTLWDRNLNNGGNLRISFGQTLYWDCLNYRGGFSYLYATSGSTLMAFEPASGNWVFNYTNYPGGTNYYDRIGDFLQYSIVNGRLLQWNSSYVAMQGRTGMAESWGSTVQGTTWNATTGYDINISITGTLASTSIVYAFPEDRVITANASNTGVTICGISLKRGSEGQVLFSNTWTAPAEWKDLTVVGSIGQAGWTAFSQEDMVGTFWTKENRVSYAFSLSNGSYLWATDPPQDYKDAWSDTITLRFGPDKVIAYNKYYSASVSGIIYCYDISNGKLLWTYNATDKYAESYLGTTWWQAPLFVTDGKIYTGTLEHSPLNPLPRGAPFLCLNATTGDLIFEADGLFRQTRWGGRAIIGDSVIATMDTYDQQIYAIGKGPSKITVMTPDTATASNNPILIKGTVMDISPGTTSDSLKLRFPNGVPAVSDASQSQWMLYVYKQFEQPSNTTGVPVSIDAVDPNGNYVHIGDTTSDAQGNYYFEYTPATNGRYTIYATFPGSDAYYASTAENQLIVGSAQATPTATTTTPVSSQQYEMYTIISLVVILVAIAIATVIIVRKKP